MPEFTMGLDLGQSHDCSALALVEHVWEVRDDRRYLFERDRRPPAHVFHVRALRRWERGTPYTSVVDDVVESLHRTEYRYDAQLIYDATGVGRAVGDLLHQSYTQGRAGYRMPLDFTFTNESKRNLFSDVLVALEQDRLRTAEIPLHDELLSELPNFHQKITAGGRTTVDIARDSGGHGDLATAVVIAMAYPEMVRRYDMRFVEVPNPQPKEQL